MDENFASSCESPRNLGFFAVRGSNSSGNADKGMTNDLIQKPSLPILDRFSALQRQREEELSLSDDENFPGPRNEEIVRLYEIVLSELSYNSKPIITDLTIIAGEHSEHAEGIADVICDRIIEAPVEQKLPSLYLLDSIVKNIGHEYVKFFASRLPEVFCEAYQQVDPNLYPAMRHLFGTWSAVFPSSVLRKIEAELQFSPQANHRSSDLSALRSSESPSPQPTHGIHINPKYLEARRQLEYSSTTNDIQNGKGISSILQIYRQKPASEYGEYDIDHAKLMPPRIRTRGLDSPKSATYTSSIGRIESLLPSKTGFPRPSSPSRSIQHSRSVSPPMNGFVTDNSPGRVVERAYSSRTGFEYGPSRVIQEDGERSNSWIKHRPEDNHRRLEHSSGHSLSNGYDLQRPRALIDAYGNYRGKDEHNEKPLKVELPHLNGINSKVASRSWQNTEEEEYVWEDMSPTFADRSRSNDILFSNPPLGSLSTRTGVGRSNATLPGHNFRSNWPGQSKLTMLDDSSVKAEDGGSIMRFQGSRYPQDPWSSSHHFLPSSQSRMESSSADDHLNVEKHVGHSLHSHSKVPLKWDPVNVHKSHSTPVLPINLRQKLTKSQFDLLDASKPPVVNQGPSKSFIFPGQHLDAVERMPFLNQQAGLISQNQQNQGQSLVQPQLFQSHMPYKVSQPLSHRVLSQGHGAVMNTIRLNPIPGIPSSSVTMHNIPNSSYFQDGDLPPLPPGPRPASLQIGLTPPNLVPVSSHPPPGNAFSGLISSLIGQGLISLPGPVSVQDSVGVEFNPDVLKVRHESAISALYVDLPRQCTTCGLRFKCQEEHSSHMDWHVTKNRLSKSRKQKPSRKWFISASVWLSSAEALGNDAVPVFLPTEAVVEKKNDEEMTVPADENQDVCALCGEPFDDFYSDETEEWMYRGAVYMNAPDGLIEGMDRSQVGPIVHAKCRSESTVASPDDLVVDEWGNPEEVSQRKRPRS